MSSSHAEGGLRVWMAYSYMHTVLMVSGSARRFNAFKNCRKVFSQIRKEMPFGTPFSESFKELLRRIETADDSLDEEDKRLLEQELEYFERFEIIREDHQIPDSYPPVQGKNEHGGLGTGNSKNY